MREKEKDQEKMKEMRDTQTRDHRQTDRHTHTHKHTHTSTQTQTNTHILTAHDLKKAEKPAARNAGKRPVTKRYLSLFLHQLEELLRRSGFNLRVSCVRFVCNT
jgi:hypothetical protein